MFVSSKFGSREIRIYLVNYSVGHVTVGSKAFLVFLVEYSIIWMENKIRHFESILHANGDLVRDTYSWYTAVIS